MKAALVALVALAGVAPAHVGAGGQAKKPAQQDCLETAQAQGELTACAADKARKADKRLNASYQAALCYVDPEEKADFVAAQRAWIAFRDADCRVWGGGDGSIAPMNYSLCLAELSDDRAKELDAWPPNAPRSAYESSCRK